VVIRKEVADIWIRLDPSCKKYLNKKGGLILTLDKSVYGLKQAPVKFQMHLKNVFEELGHIKNQFDDCIFTKVTIDTFSIISTHVDDILQVSNSNELIEQLHNGLIKAYILVIAMN
jgi:hypothetical protein